MDQIIQHIFKKYIIKTALWAGIICKISTKTIEENKSYRCSTVHGSGLQ